MSILVSINHFTRYKYDRPVTLGPQLIRLRPAPHCRTPVLNYSLKVTPAEHFVNWQQDPQSNWIARYVFPEKTTEFSIEVDFLAEASKVDGKPGAIRYSLAALKNIGASAVAAMVEERRAQIAVVVRALGHGPYLSAMLALTTMLSVSTFAT